jgi:hypothetical protein
MDQDIPTEGSSHSPIIGRTVVVVAVMLVIAAIHAFRVGSYLDGRWFTLYYSYFSDIIVPFGMYFLLCLNEVSLRFLRDWRVKALLVFGLASLTELGQAVGIPLLGLTFDPLDFVMFAVGVSLAVLVDKIVFGRIFSFWSSVGSALPDSPHR